MLKKLKKMYLIRGLPDLSFSSNQVCLPCVKGKKVRSLFNPKNEVSITKSFELLHMDLCGPVCVPSIGGKKYAYFIIDDYSKYSWVLFLAFKEETFTKFLMFVIKMQ